MTRKPIPCASYSAFALVLAALLAGPTTFGGAASAPSPAGAQPEAGSLDPRQVKVGDKIKLVLKEINQRSGAIVLTAVKSAYGTVRSITRLEIDGQENIVFEIAPHGSDGKTVIKYDKETGQTFRVEPTVKFGTLQIAKIMPMPSEEEMGKIAAFQERGGGIDVAALDEDKETLERRIQSLRTQVKSLKMAIADQEATALNPVKPPTLLVRDKGGASRVDSASDASAQEIVQARRNAAEAAVIRLRFRLSEAEDDLREELRKAADYGVTGLGVDDLAGLPPAERRILLSSQAKTLGGEVRRLKQAIVDNEASAKEAVKPPVLLVRDKGGASRVDSASDASAQAIVAARKNAEAAAIIRIKARLAEREDELKVVREELAKLDRAEHPGKP